MTKTPILLITYIRSEYARQAFDAIKAAKPQKLYFYSNKAPADDPEALKKNNEIRSYIEEIDWDCDLKTFFREENVEIYTSLFSAKDWIFANEKNAIILEEDCVASLAFFDYCDKLLDYYENEPKIWLLSGNNFSKKGNPEGQDIFVSRFGHCYGWATWADRWNTVDREMKSWDAVSNSNHFLEYYGNKRRAKFFKKKFKTLFENLSTANPWDWLKTYTVVKSKAYTIVAKENLVSNIGVKGHHNKGKEVNKNNNLSTPTTPTYEINSYPEILEPTSFDDYHFHHHFWLRRTTLYKRIKRKLKKILGVH